ALAGGIAFGCATALLNLTSPVYFALHPQLLGVPLQAVGAWIVYLYAGYAVTAVLVTPGPTWQSALPFCGIAALLTTALELVADPVGVRLGIVVYSHGGAFVPEIGGTNGAHGVLMATFLVWSAVATTTYVAFWMSSGGVPDAPARGRTAALLFYLSVFLV